MTSIEMSRYRKKQRQKTPDKGPPEVPEMPEEEEDEEDD